MSLDQNLESPIRVSCTDLLSLRGLKGMERMKGLKMTCRLGDFQNVHVFQFASFWVMQCNNQVIKPCVRIPKCLSQIEDFQLASGGGEGMILSFRQSISTSINHHSVENYFSCPKHVLAETLDTSTTSVQFLQKNDM